MPRAYFFDHSGSWSGGGLAFLENADFAARRHPILNGGPDDVPIIPRNIPARGRRRPGRFVLAPQNAWPWTPRAHGAREVALLLRLRVASEFYVHRATGVLRISEAIPARAPDRTSRVIHNVLDEGFERALKDSERCSVRPAEGRLVSIGSGYSYRNLVRLLHGYERYRSSGGGHELWISGPAGSPKTIGTVDALAAQIPGVTVTWGSLTRAECLAALRSAAGVVLPSLVEASPLSALEAVALTPHVVFSDIPGHRGIVAEYVDVPETAFFNPLSITAVQAALHAVAEGPAEECHASLNQGETRDAARIDWGTSVADWLTDLG